MSFIDKLKQWTGIGGVKLKLELPSAVIPKNANVVEGRVALTTKSPQHVNSIKIELEEVYSRGAGAEKKTQYFSLGTTALPGDFDIAPGEEKSFSFSLPFVISRSMSQQMAEQGGVMGTMGKLASLADREKSMYRVKASADVKGAALGPTDSMEVKLG